VAEILEPLKPSLLGTAARSDDDFVKILGAIVESQGDTVFCGNKLVYRRLSGDLYALFVHLSEEAIDDGLRVI